MSKLFMFSVYDRKGENYSPPFYQPSLGLGERAMQDAVADERSTLKAHPEDFDLYLVGEFDQSTGKAQSLDKLQFICTAVSCVRK